MKEIHHRIIFTFALFVVVATIVLAYDIRRTSAQADIIGLLTDRLTAAGVPLKAIQVLSEIPLQIKITIQSFSDTGQAAPADALYVHAVEREANLVQIDGFRLDRFTTVVVNTQGENLYWVDSAVHGPIRDDLPASKLDDAETTQIVADRLDTFDMTVDSLTVMSSADGSQTLEIELSVANLESTNAALPAFIPYLGQFIEELNKTEGTQIAICKVSLTDAEGQLLLSYVVDMQLQSQKWWMADGVSQEWFPRPRPTTIPS